MTVLTTGCASGALDPSITARVGALPEVAVVLSELTDPGTDDSVLRAAGAPVVGQEIGRPRRGGVR